MKEPYYYNDLKGVTPEDGFFQFLEPRYEWWVVFSYDCEPIGISHHTKFPRLAVAVKQMYNPVTRIWSILGEDGKIIDGLESREAYELIPKAN